MREIYINRERHVYIHYFYTFRLNKVKMTPNKIERIDLILPLSSFLL